MNTAATSPSAAAKASTLSNFGAPTDSLATESTAGGTGSAEDADEAAAADGKGSVEDEDDEFAADDFFAFFAF
jgi:hypothetical protein